MRDSYLTRRVYLDIPVERLKDFQRRIYSGIGSLEGTGGTYFHVADDSEK